MSAHSRAVRCVVVDGTSRGGSCSAHRRPDCRPAMAVAVCKVIASRAEQHRLLPRAPAVGAARCATLISGGARVVLRERLGDIRYPSVPRAPGSRPLPLHPAPAGPSGVRRSPAPHRAGSRASTAVRYRVCGAWLADDGDTRCADKDNRLAEVALGEDVHEAAPPTAQCPEVEDMVSVGICNACWSGLQLRHAHVVAKHQFLGLRHCGRRLVFTAAGAERGQLRDSLHYCAEIAATHDPRSHHVE